jgi:hypothetical protein
MVRYVERVSKERTVKKVFKITQKENSQLESQEKDG